MHAEPNFLPAEMEHFVRFEGLAGGKNALDPRNVSPGNLRGEQIALPPADQFAGG